MKCDNIKIIISLLLGGICIYMLSNIINAPLAKPEALEPIQLEISTTNQDSNVNAKLSNIDASD
jgi:hypothetical protein